MYPMLPTTWFVGVGEQNQEFCFRHVDFEMAVRVLMEVLGRRVDTEVCDSEERSEVERAARGRHLGGWFSSSS